jgi:hypothetical protein
MNDHTSNILAPTRQRAASRLRELLDEVRMLMVSFPDLRDAFDADGLPISFILERGSRPAEPGVRRLDTISTSDDPTGPRSRTAGGERRRGRRKQPSDD